MMERVMLMSRVLCRVGVCRCFVYNCLGERRQKERKQDKDPFIEVRK